MGRFVIAVYRPRPGRERKLEAALEEHLKVLRQEGLVTQRPAYVMRAPSGEVVEVFEWKSAEAISAAHQNEAVAALWARFEDACEYLRLADLKEAGDLFPEFEPIEVGRG